MKTTNIFIIITILAFVSASYAKTDNLPHPVKISLRKACEHRGIVKSIYQQVDSRTMLQPDQNRYYCARIEFQHKTYVIFGKYEEWVDFFLRDAINNQPGTSENESNSFKSTKCMEKVNFRH